jgi:glutaredoxin
MAGRPPAVVLYTRRSCHLCDSARHVIERIADRMPLTLETIDVDAPDREDARRLYDHHVPVVFVNGVEIARHRLDEETLAAAIRRTCTIE